MMRIATIAALAVALVGCGGGEGEDPPTIVATATVASAGPGEPPMTTTALPPAPITPTAIDTSDWKTYESPLGFSIKYPPTWLVVSRDVAEAPEGRIRIRNEVRQAPVLEPGESHRAGDAWIEISPLTYPTGFDSAALMELCAPAEASSILISSAVSEATLAGLPAVLCEQESRALDGDRQVSFRTFWVGLPSGRVVHISTQLVDGTPDAARELDAALLSVRVLDD